MFSGWKLSNVGRLCDGVLFVPFYNEIGSCILVAYVMTSCAHSEQGCKLQYISKISKARLETPSVYCHRVSVALLFW